MNGEISKKFAVFEGGKYVHTVTTTFHHAQRMCSLYRGDVFSLGSDLIENGNFQKFSFILPYMVYGFCVGTILTKMAIFEGSIAPCLDVFCVTGNSTKIMAIFNVHIPLCLHAFLKNVFPLRGQTYE